MSTSDPHANLITDTEEYGDEFSNCCASFTHWIGSRLTRPATWILLTGVKLIAKLDPGQRGQCSSCFFEVLVRMYYVIKILVLLPFVLAFSSIGSVLRALAGLSRRQLVFAANPSTTFTGIANENEPLRICTFNTALMPNFIAAYNGLRPPLQRVREIAVAIRHTDDHIVCLQEVFHPHCGRELRTLLQDVYPYTVYNVGFQSWGLDSGLMILSKYPISSPRYIQHPMLDGDDKWARKGILMVTAHLGGGRRIVVLTTHLNGGGPNSEAARRKQIFGITKGLREYITEQNLVSPRGGTSGGGPAPQPISAAFQCGDFNIGPMTKEGIPDKEWTSHVDFFTRYNYHYIHPEERGDGTTFDFGIPAVGWAMRQLDQWKLTNERVDQILAHVGGPIGTNTATTTPAAGGVAVNVGATGSGTIPLQVPYGELVIDRMHGSSDHAAIRGTFYWGRAAPPLQGDGQAIVPVATLPVQPTIPTTTDALMAGVMMPTLPSAGFGYGAGGGFSAPTTVTIHA